MAPINMWAMKKPELFRAYRGLYYTQLSGHYDKPLL